MSSSVNEVIAAVWRIESVRIVAALTRYVGDFARAEDLAQDALAEALTKWPEQGVPDNPGAWLTAVAKRRAIDLWRRQERHDERLRELGRQLELAQAFSGEFAVEPDEISDDVLRLICLACHPVLSREAQVALTLRVVGGLRTEEIARAFLVPTATIQQRIVRAKKTLTEAGVVFETPTATELVERLASVLSVLYLIFTEGHAATAGEDWMRPDLSREALRLTRAVAAAVPGEPEVHGLLALLELTAARFPARTGSDGKPVLLEDQDRRRWDRGAIARGRAALARVDALGRGRGAYALQAGIAEQHDIAASAASTDWTQIVRLYDGLLALNPSPVVELNRAVAVSLAEGPEAALEIVDRLAGIKKLASWHLIPAVRGELLLRLGRDDEARAELTRAAELTANAQERAVLLASRQLGTGRGRAG